MNSFLSCLVCFNGCIYVQIQFLKSVACFPGLPIHLRSIMGIGKGRKWAQTRAVLNFVTSAKLRVAGAR